MNFLLVLPALLSFLILAAHFFRGQYAFGAIVGLFPFGNLLLAALCLACACFLLVGRRWAMRMLQIALLAGALEWAFTAYQVMQERLAIEAKWHAAMIIFSAVGTLCLLAAALFQTKRLKKFYATSPDQDYASDN